MLIVAGKDIFIIESLISSDMQRLSNWCKENELFLNLHKGKTEAMMFGTAPALRNQDSFNIVYDGCKTVNVTTSYKYLGVKIDQTLNLNTNFQYTYRKANGKLRLLQKLRPQLSRLAALRIYQSMILPTLTYCGSLSLNFTSGQTRKWRSLHSRALEIIDDTNPVNIPSAIEQVKIHSCDLVKKCLDKKVCESFRDYFQLTTHGKFTRNGGSLLVLPKIRLEYARGSFKFSGAKLFNELPLEIRRQVNSSNFGTLVRQHFLSSLSQ